MNLFSDRLRVVKLYEKFLKENPIIADCPLTVLSFLEGNKLLRDCSEFVKGVEI
jgi:hypothetical protein